MDGHRWQMMGRQWKQTVVSRFVTSDPCSITRTAGRPPVGGATKLGVASLEAILELVCVTRCLLVFDGELWSIKSIILKVCMASHFIFYVFLFSVWSQPLSSQSS